MNLCNLAFKVKSQALESYVNLQNTLKVENILQVKTFINKL